MNFRALPYLAAVSAMVTILAGVWVLDRSEQQRFREQRRIDALNQVSTTRARLEGALNSRLFLTEGLVAHVSTHPDIGSKEFESLARVLAAKQTGIRIIELAKDTVISHIYPPENKIALGSNLLEKSQERQAIARAINTRSTVVAGPVHWSDGTGAFISHTPIFITPKEGIPKGGPYWGLATIIINKHTLLAEAGLDLLSGEAGEWGSGGAGGDKSSPSSPSSLQYALRGQDGLGARGAVFYGDASVFEQNPVALEVSLPNGSWQLAAIPAGGWPRESPTSRWLRLGGGSLAILTGILVFVLVQAPARSREAVERATAALLLANEQLQAILEAVPGMVSWISSDLNYLGVNRHLAAACKLSPEDFQGKEIGFLNGNTEFTELVRQFFARSDREAVSEVRVEANGITRTYLVVAQKYDRDRAAFTVGIDITERKMAEEHLRASEAELKALFAAMTDIITVRDRLGRCLKIASTNPSLLDRPASELLGKTLHEVLDQKTADTFLGYIHHALEVQQTVQFEYTLLVDNTDMWFAVTVSPILNDSVLLVARDVTKYKRTEEALRQAEEKYRSIFENAIEGIFQTLPNGRYLSANPALARIYGYSNPAELIEKLTANAKLYLDPYRRAEFTSQMQLHDQVSKFESQVYRSDGQPIWVSESVRAVRGNNGELLYYEGIIEDITERKRVEDELLHNAFHDALTGLPNRLMFMERLNLAIKRSKENSDYWFAVLFLDLDRFKVINDSLGHMMGDQLLIAFAQRLQGVLGESQQPENDEQVAEKFNASGAIDPGSFTIARLGGDEFTILLEGIQDTNSAMEVADRIHKQLTLPFNINGLEIFTTTSIGIVLNWDLGDTKAGTQTLQLWTGGGKQTLKFKTARNCDDLCNFSSIRHSQLPIRDSAEDLLRDADIAMYQAKARGKARSAVFDRAMYAGAVARLQLENDLRRAISAQEFQVYYQPIVCLENGRISGFEALVRWQHPHRGLVSPSSFIPLAEETGLIIPLGTWVLWEATRQMRDWQLQFQSNPPMTISVNLSGQQFSQPDLIDKFKQILQETGLDGSSLKLEITETVITEGAGNARTILKRLRDLNIQLCIDDFGTGYSSLSRLHHFPINTLKIDRSFVSRMGKKGRARPSSGIGEIVQTIVMLAHNLGMDAIAEGVETAEQLAQLKLHNCEYGQGYFFSKPLTSIAATAMLAAQDYNIN